jgi:hypothetical protein
LRTWCRTAFKLIWGSYFLLTSLYCLLAYMPYTYCALIKAPPFAWMPWFVHHYAWLYWAALAAGVSGAWPGKRINRHLFAIALQVGLGLYITGHPFMAELQSNWSAYAWSLLALMPIVVTVGVSLWEAVLRSGNSGLPAKMLSYSGAVITASVVALLYALATHVRHRMELNDWRFHSTDMQLTAWSLMSHLAVAVAIVTVLNLVRLASRKCSRPRLFEGVLLGALACTGLGLGIRGFLNSALGFQGLRADAYAAALATAVLLFGFSLLSLTGRSQAIATTGSRLRLIVLTLALGIAAVLLPGILADGDWNGIIQSSFTLMFWSTAGICLYRVRPRSGQYSAVTVVAIILFTALTYKGLQATAIFWGKPLGQTSDDIAHQFDIYAAQDASFELTQRLLGNRRAEACGELCRVLRAYTNIRDGQARVDLNLVANLVPQKGERPDIFIFVIDSMRPDYLGAYNPNVDFTPRLDSLAHESVVFRNAFTQYAGTTLSEPAIWSGALLLHAHYLQPFSRVNSLEKMAKADGYQVVVSYDTVLPNLLSPSDQLVKLDTDKLWNEYEVCSTVEQTEHFLEQRADSSRPVLFFTQPMNVHQFAKNKLPLPNALNWRARHGFNGRIAYEVSLVDRCIGEFVDYLKRTDRYEKSIIIVTSDHGDATGEFGRRSHSLWIYPEIMRVPLIVHLPTNMRARMVYDDTRITTLTDITPSLLYLLGHRPIEENPLFGRPLFTETRQELDKYREDELFLASDARAVYGLLTNHGRYLYTTYDSPAESYLFDLQVDPNAQHNIVTDDLKRYYDERVISHLRQIADFYGYKAGIGSLLGAGNTPVLLPKGYIRIRASDGFMRDIPATTLDAARREDPGITVVPQ